MEVLTPRTIIKKRQAVWLAIALVMCANQPALAQENDRYYKVEAAFLYNFFNYITWPGYASPQELHKPTICIYEEDPIQPYLEYVQQKMASERSLDIHVLSNAAAASECNLLFTRHRLTKQDLQVIPSSTLIVTEPLDSLDRGVGMIELDREGQEIQMKINQVDMTEKGFQVSSRLLALAMR